MTIFTKVLTNLAAGAAKSLNGKAASEAVQQRHAKTASQGCTPCAARAQIAAAQKQLGVKGWYGK